MRKVIILLLLVLMAKYSSVAVPLVTNVVMFIIEANIPDPEIPLFAGVLLNGITYVISFTLVGYIFRKLDFFNSFLMKIAYFLISFGISTCICSLYKLIV